MKYSKKPVVTVGCMVVFMLISSVAMANIINVPAQQPTIQDGIAAANNGDTVLVAAGIYEESIIFWGHSIVLLSEDGPEVTTIQAPGGSYTYILPEDFDTSSSGMNGAAYRGLVDANSSPAVVILDNCDKNAVISGFTIDGFNLVRCVYGMYSSAEISDCIIENGFGGYDAGGVFIQYGAPLIRDNIVRNNYAPISGAGIFVSLGDGFGMCYITGNTCYNNSSGNGPAISLIRGDDAIISGNIAYNNTALGNSEIRGAIYFWGDNIQALNNTMDNNTAGFTYLNSTDCDVRNNIMSNNIEYGLQARSYVGPNVNVTVDYNDIWNTTGPDYNAEAIPGGNDISADPLYGDEYILTVGSPCIDAGDPNPIYNDPDGSRNDMGAIPYEQESPPIITIIMDPDIMYAFEAFPVDEGAEATLYLGGDFEPGYNVDDIVCESIVINGVVQPNSTQIVSHPDFSGNVLMVSFNKAEFILTYGILWDITTQNVSIAADFSDDNSFVEEGQLTIVGHRLGDVNYDGYINIFDITYMISWLYLGGPEPLYTESADVNCDSTVNLFDITYMVVYIYKNGPEPTCQ
jgi:parallel beta-helix repeat protein